ncbi:nucleoside diphosphate kinase [Echinococcus multilocularis]|uniref:nucleoside-diphosphate kinase n=1 Tax=Echinococcus multilocularis TaxID=6211 RepID=A0A068YML6_ECHMU|nr:nucleoside diphosphate kinase [Echinococcus multilocularis]
MTSALLATQREWSGMSSDGGFQERTFIMVKPDGVQRGLVGEIIKRFERRGFKLVAMKFMHADEALLNKHYEALSGKPFFKNLIAYMSSGPVVPMVWEGAQAVKLGLYLVPSAPILVSVLVPTLSMDLTQLKLLIAKLRFGSKARNWSTISLALLLTSMLTKYFYRLTYNYNSDLFNEVADYDQASRGLISGAER